MHEAGVGAVVTQGLLRLAAASVSRAPTSTVMSWEPSWRAV